MSGAQGEQAGSCVQRLRVFGEDASERGRRTRVCSELKRGGGGGGPAPGAPGGLAEADGGWSFSRALRLHSGLSPLLSDHAGPLPESSFTRSWTPGPTLPVSACSLISST